MKKACLVVLVPALACAFLAWIAPRGASAADDAAPAETRRLVAQMIDAHGGLTRWASAPTVSFVSEFQPVGAEVPLVTHVTVEQRSRHAFIDVPGTEMRMAWDGARAWSENWKMPIPPRFLALLQYYFLNLPWLTQDPGVHLSAPGTGKILGDSTEYATVRMTFDPGVGDSPRDYYVLFIDPATKHLKACEYIVTYTAVLPEGSTASPPHVLVYQDFEKADGLLVPTRYTIHEQGGSVYATNRTHDWSFTKPFDASRMIMPAGAVVDPSKP